MAELIHKQLLMEKLLLKLSQCLDLILRMKPKRFIT